MHIISLHVKALNLIISILQTQGWLQGPLNSRPCFLHIACLLAHKHPCFLPPTGLCKTHSRTYQDE